MTLPFAIASCRRCCRSLINELMGWHLARLGMHGVCATWRFVCIGCLPRAREPAEVQLLTMPSSARAARKSCHRQCGTCCCCHAQMPRKDARMAAVPEAVANALQFANGPSDGDYYWLNTLMPPSGRVFSHIVGFSVDFLARCAQLSGEIGLWLKQFTHTVCLCSLCQVCLSPKPARPCTNCTSRSASRSPVQQPRSHRSKDPDSQFAMHARQTAHVPL